MNPIQPLPNPDSYTYKTEWSHEDQEFVSTVSEFPFLSCLGRSPEAAHAALKAVVFETLIDLRNSGGFIPQPEPQRVPAPAPPQPSYYPTFPIPTHHFQMPQYSAAPAQGVSQSVNVVVGGGRYYRRSRRTMHAWLTLFTCGAWAVVWIPDEIFTGSGTRTR